MKIVWNVVAKKPQETFGEGEKLYTKQTVIIEEDFDTEYPNRIAIDFWGDNLQLTKWLQMMDKVEIKYSTKVTEKDDKAYNTIRGYKLKVLEKATEDDLPF